MTSPLALNLVAILRQHALHQSNRPVSANQPLGATGLGLDSLALLQFITAVENQYEIELPESIWTEKGDLTIARFEALILSQRPELASASVEELISRSADVRHQPHSDREHTFYDVPRASIVARAWRKVRHEQRLFILERDLTAGEFPRHTAIIPIEIRLATPEDILQSADMFPAVVRTAKMSVYRERIALGVTSYVARVGGKIIGIDWLSGAGAFEPLLGLDVRMRPGSCFGFDLNEHPDFRGKGVGMALLSHSLEDARRQQFVRQFTIVYASNTKMLSAAIQIFGFVVVGEIITRSWFGRVQSAWRLGDRTGRNHIEL